MIVNFIDVTSNCGDFNHLWYACDSQQPRLMLPITSHNGREYDDERVGFDFYKLCDNLK